MNTAFPKLQNASNFGQSHRRALEDLHGLGEDTTTFIAKFNDRGFFKKHWNHESDKKKFRELATRLDSLIQEMQLDILTDTRLFLQELDRDHDLDLKAGLDDIKQQLEGLGAGQDQLLEGQADLVHMLRAVQEQMSRVQFAAGAGAADQYFMVILWSTRRGGSWRRTTTTPTPLSLATAPLGKFFG